MAFALPLFLITLSCIVIQPKGISIGWFACGGAIIALVLNIVNLSDVMTVVNITWNATLTLIAIIIISLILDQIGYFEWCALKITKLAKGSGKRLFFYLLCLGAFVSATFTNDGTVLILTPIVLSILRQLKLEESYILPFIMACGFIADSTSLPFVVSNLVNIISADYFSISFTQYTVAMIIPTIASFFASCLILFIFYRKQIIKKYDVDELPSAAEVIKDKKLFKISWFILFILFLGYFSCELLDLPVSIVAGITAIVFVILAKRSEHVKLAIVIKESPWAIVFFSIGLYVVVYGLQNAGLTNLFASLIEWTSKFGFIVSIIGMGYYSAFLSSLLNNLPAVMIGALSIEHANVGNIVKEGLIFSNVIGSDLGPKITPIGSLATLIWMHILKKKGVNVSWGMYFKHGIILTIPVLFFTLLSLSIWLLII
ncbi:arsenic transporter [Bacillus sp. EAC]|uniref:arsenic transporter n=1 Tax=Bacillus sp. EAC TaxID=1978338 RepID=UPI000B440D1E|nr:arsenic transporter [Bacillus sp. EAC]